MRKTLLYILGIATVMLSSCHDEWDSSEPLNGKEKTPITVVTNIHANTSVSRAVDDKWEANDELLAYIQHVTTTGTSPDLVYDGEVTGTGVGPRLAKLTVSSLNNDHKNIATNYGLTDASALGMATGETMLYWDDFSNSVDAAHDLRTPNHALRVKYGLCYNGGTPSTALGADASHKTEDGIIDWTVATNQSSTNTADTKAFQHSDLLFSGTQTPVAYAHGTNNTINGRNNVLTIPYTHAMSKVTIEIELKDGFDANSDGKAIAFGTNNTTPTLYANRVTSVTAPTQTLSTTVASGDDRKIQMYLSDDEATENKHRVYEAIIAPTVMKADNLLAQVSVDGNNYDINLTDELLTTVPTGATAAWSSQLKSYSEASSILTQNSTGNYDATNGGITLSGVNYRIKVTLSKQQIQVQAFIAGWDDVSASVDGTIMFDTNVDSDDATGTAVANTSTFDLWRSTTNADAASYDADGSAQGIQKATTCVYNVNKWIGSPKIYWANGTESYYFRALAKMDDATTNKIISVDGDLGATQGLDLLWAQTSRHKGKDENGNIIQENGADKVYNEGSLINPRKGTVPLSFIHAMSKISVKLQSAGGSEGVDIDDAKISIINLYDGGTINISTGLMEDFTSPADLASPGDPRTILGASVNSSHELLNQIVIPQSLVVDKNANTRGTIPTFYQNGELTKIYDDGMSLPTGGGSGTYYLTSTLERVNYDASELTAIYADGTSISDGGASETYVTSTLELVATQPAILYNNQQEVDEENERHLIVDQYGNQPGEANYETTYESGYTPVTVGDVRIPAIPQHYKVNANSKKATTSTFKCYKKNTSSEQHNPGELKTAGNKIMMYITLNDGSRYSIELATCKDSNNDKIEEWKPGKHYTYTITLGKEEITFRALIKNWEEVTGGGNANLDW